MNNHRGRSSLPLASCYASRCVDCSPLANPHPAASQPTLYPTLCPSPPLHRLIGQVPHSQALSDPLHPNTLDTTDSTDPHPGNYPESLTKNSCQDRRGGTRQGGGIYCSSSSQAPRLRNILRFMGFRNLCRFMSNTLQSRLFLTQTNIRFWVKFIQELISLKNFHY